MMGINDDGKYYEGVIEKDNFFFKNINFTAQIVIFARVIRNIKKGTQR